MRDGTLTPATRLVGWEIYWCVNKVSGEAWPSEETIARRLGIDVKTVKRGVKALKLAEYIEVENNGRSNIYRPILTSEHQAASPESSVGPARRETDMNRDIWCADKGHFVRTNEDKYGPLTPSRNPNITSSSTHQLHRPASKGSSEGIRIGNNLSLREQRGDEKLERIAIELFNKRGLDGLEILSRLHDTDHGHPRLRLLQLIRNGTLSDNDLAVAHAAAVAIARRTGAA